MTGVLSTAASVVVLAVVTGAEYAAGGSWLYPAIAAFWAGATCYHEVRAWR